MNRPTKWADRSAKPVRPAIINPHAGGLGAKRGVWKPGSETHCNYQGFLMSLYHPPFGVTDRRQYWMRLGSETATKT